MMDCLGKPDIDKLKSFQYYLDVSEAMCVNNVSPLTGFLICALLPQR